MCTPITELGFKHLNIHNYTLYGVLYIREHNHTLLCCVIYLTHRPAPGKSIAEIRRQMSRERDRELSTPVALPKEESREYDYSRLKEKKMAEERLYRNQGYKSHRARWDDSNPVVSFKEEIGHFDDHSDKVSIVCG